MANRLPIGTRVKTIVGVRRTGIIIRPFYWRESTDGTYCAPKPSYIAVVWDDGTRGYAYKLHLEVIRRVITDSGYLVNEELK